MIANAFATPERIPSSVAWAFCFQNRHDLRIPIDDTLQDAYSLPLLFNAALLQLASTKWRQSLPTGLMWVTVPVQTPRGGGA